MSYTRTTFAAVIAAALVLGVWGGELDLAQQIQRDFNMGLFARQDQQGVQIGLTNLNTFTGDLGAEPVPITLSSDPDHPYLINGDTAPDFNTAVDKTCDFQKNDCAELANGASKGKFEVSDCDEQSSEYIPSVALLFFLLCLVLNLLESSRSASRLLEISCPCLASTTDSTKHERPAE
ncbi:hypothetical protein GGR58DRAFT_345590 [Xylaria digitata]|nr:hypothetical protein GGR58DRAFT_345590 [Xylaria digitata]